MSEEKSDDDGEEKSAMTSGGRGQKKRVSDAAKEELVSGKNRRNPTTKDKEITEKSKSPSKSTRPLAKKRASVAKEDEPAAPANHRRVSATAKTSSDVIEEEPDEAMEETPIPKGRETGAKLSPGFVALSSGLPEELKTGFAALAKKLKWKIGADFEPGVTHMVYAPMDDGKEKDSHVVLCRRTVKLLMGMLSGAWIISSDCKLWGGGGSFTSLPRCILHSLREILREIQWKKIFFEENKEEETKMTPLAEFAGTSWGLIGWLIDWYIGIRFRAFFSPTGLEQCSKTGKIVPEEHYEFDGTIANGDKGGFAKARKNTEKKVECDNNF